MKTLYIIASCVFRNKELCKTIMLITTRIATLNLKRFSKD